MNRTERQVFEVAGHQVRLERQTRRSGRGKEYLVGFVAVDAVTGKTLSDCKGTIKLALEQAAKFV